MGCDIHPHYEVRKPVPADRLAFVRAIEAAPLDDAPRLVFADWLAERNDPNEGAARDSTAAILKAEATWQFHDYRGKYQDGTYDDGSPRTDYPRLFEDPLFIARWYAIFGALAGVRTGNPRPIVPPRGFPPDPSDRTFEEYVYRVTDDPEEAENRRGRWCLRSKAAEWTTPQVYNGRTYPPSSVWFDEAAGILSHPDWHTPSWLTAAELLAHDWRELDRDANASGHYHGNDRGPFSKFRNTTVKAMAALAADPRDVRLVFWFDN